MFNNAPFVVHIKGHDKVQGKELLFVNAFRLLNLLLAQIENLPAI